MLITFMSVYVYICMCVYRCVWVCVCYDRICPLEFMCFEINSQALALKGEAQYKVG